MGAPEWDAVANFVALIDPDRERRESFLDAVRPRLAPLEGLEFGTAESGDCAILWARAAQAPVATASSPR